MLEYQRSTWLEWKGKFLTLSLHISCLLTDKAEYTESYKLVILV